MVENFQQFFIERYLCQPLLFGPHYGAVAQYHVFATLRRSLVAHLVHFGKNVRHRFHV
jgi:hypothetical protein